MLYCALMVLQLQACFWHDMTSVRLALNDRVALHSRRALRYNRRHGRPHMLHAASGSLRARLASWHRAPHLQATPSVKQSKLADRVAQRQRRPSTTARQAVGSAGGSPEPVPARLLSAFLKTSDVPYSSYIPEPRSFLHATSAVVKEVWLLVLLFYMAKASAVMRFGIAAGCAGLTLAALPARLWKPQLRRLGLFALIIFASAAIGTDVVPPMLQTRQPSPGLEGLYGIPKPAQGYRYVILHLWFFTITRRSISLGLASASLTFIALQSASLCLTCTPPEELAMALRTLLRPLAILRVPVNEIGLTLLLSLRFMALVFEEVRNLALGLAARGVKWNSLGPAGGLQILIRLTGRLFANLMQRSVSIAEAMCARGFVGSTQHHLYLTRTQPSSMTANVLAMMLLILLGLGVRYV